MLAAIFADHGSDHCGDFQFFFSADAFYIFEIFESVGSARFD
jgi:hypothetical protein